MKLITITGPSGAGKDTVAKILSKMTGIPVLVSYTTRPMREGEVNGREHWFVKRCPQSHDMMLAYTVYGGYEYWTEIGQVNDAAIYVIDERGLKELHDSFPDIELVTLYVTASRLKRLQRGVVFERMVRDKDREMLDEDYYDHVIKNNYSREHLRERLTEILDHITKTE